MKTNRNPVKLWVVYAVMLPVVTCGARPVAKIAAGTQPVSQEQ